MVERLPHPDGFRLVLTPNRSLSWHGNVRIWAALFVLSALIATGFTLMGAWVIIPFAGLELIALACGIYLTSRECQRQEVLSIDDEDMLEDVVEPSDKLFALTKLAATQTAKAK